MKNKKILIICAILSLFLLSTINAKIIVLEKTETLSTTEDFEQWESSDSNSNMNYSNDYLSVNNSKSTFKNIWIANSGAGTLSKVDSILERQVAIYKTGPNGAADDPSRTAVDRDGNVYVANRGTANSLVKIAGSIAECRDKNGDNIIQTSSDTNNDQIIQADEVLEWGEDECIIWFTDNFPEDAGLRGLAIDPDDNVWIGAYGKLDQLYDYHYYKLNPTNGEQLESIDV